MKASSRIGERKTASSVATDEKIAGGLPICLVATVAKRPVKLTSLSDPQQKSVYNDYDRRRRFSFSQNSQANITKDFAIRWNSGLSIL
jgi:hypothetical protein